MCCCFLIHVNNINILYIYIYIYRSLGQSMLVPYLHLQGPLVIPCVSHAFNSLGITRGIVCVHATPDRVDVMALDFSTFERRSSDRLIHTWVFGLAHLDAGLRIACWLLVRWNQIPELFCNSVMCTEDGWLPNRHSGQLAKASMLLRTSCLLWIGGESMVLAMPSEHQRRTHITHCVVIELTLLRDTRPEHLLGLRARNF
jgi:hypothetical protein